ncbi:MAG: TetR/AcrR family transcriptional regulator [Acidimicrobiales bacterium]
MAGVKRYDRTEILERAVDLFHRQGFNGTSTAELVAELGVNRKSMYAEFGSKQELFEAALDQYNAKHLSAVLAAVEAIDAGPDSIRSTFEGFASASEDWAQGRGCLLCNTAVERSALAEIGGNHVDAYFERLTTAFRNAVANGQECGQIDSGADADELAAFFTMALIGVAACAKGRADPLQIHAACRVVFSVLESHRPH